MTTPFPLTPLTDSLLLHQIDLATYLRLLNEGRDMTDFFQQLTNAVSNEGQRVVHLWEDVRRQKPAVVASRLAALRGESVRVPGRLTQARRIDKATALAFLAEHHLQVPLPGKVRYGLFLPQRYFRVLPPTYRAGLTHRADRPANEPDADLLLAVATFAQPRHLQRDGQPHRSAELLRVASRINTTVVGGLDKLLTTYLKNHPADDLMTYADRDWSDGASYRRLGFEAVDDTPPQRFWLWPDEGIRYYENALPGGVTEANARSLGYVPVFNAGSRKFVRKVEKGERKREKEC